MITAKEFAEKNYCDLEAFDEGGYLGIDTKYFAEKLIEFARFHVKAALEAVERDTDVGYVEWCYPLENIK